MMSNVTVPGWVYPVFLLVVLIIAGFAEYIGLAPKNSFNTVFLLVLGLIAPSPVFASHTTVVQTPAANINAKQVDVSPPPPKGE